MNLPQETQDAFIKENGMPMEEAISHIGKWIEEGNFESAEAGIAELKKYAADLPEASDLEAKLRAKKASSVQEVVTQKEKITERTSNLEDVSKQERFLAGIGYFGYLAVLPLAMKQNSEFCQYHGKQALLLAIVFTFLQVVAVFLPGGMAIMSILHLLVAVFAFMQANKGKLWDMPVLGDLSRKMPF